GILPPIRALFLSHNRSAAQLFERLTDLGVAEDEAHAYREHVERGQVLVTAISMRREREAAALLRRHGGLGAFEPLPEISRSDYQPARTREDVAAPDDASTS
ncbi:MAG: hypothetical protein ACRDF8_04370, partial [Chloroflexota bacterium]